jgi:hypothetical protein
MKRASSRAENRIGVKLAFERDIPRTVRLALRASLVLMACATPKPSPPPAAVQLEALPVPESDLAQAWAPPKEEVDLTVRVPIPEAPVDRRAGWREATEKTTTAVAAGRLDDARAFAARAIQEAMTLTSDERASSGSAAFLVEQKAGHISQAMNAAIAWRNACGPENVESCRGAAYRALQSLGGEAERLAEELRVADGCLQQTERSFKLPDCFPKSEQLAVLHRDDFSRARALLGRASAETSVPRKLSLLTKAEAKCSAPQCASLRRRILSKLTQQALAAKDTAGALKYSLRESKLMAEMVEPEVQLWARAESLDKLCQKFEARSGAGSCRKLEQQLNGALSFRDFSKENAGNFLGLPVVRKVNEHYAPLFEACLKEQAFRMAPAETLRLEARWVISNEGRVVEAHFQKTLDGSEVVSCLRKQFAYWRYPRFTGEVQNVEQVFTVTAAKRQPQ